MDVTQSQSVYCCNGSPGEQGRAHQHGFGCHRSCKGETLTFVAGIPAERVQTHSGVNLAAAFAGILEDFGITHKILSVTCDNASSNDAMIDELEQMMEEFAGDPNRIRCILHIVNLVAKSMLKQFDVHQRQRQDRRRRATHWTTN